MAVALRHQWKLLGPAIRYPYSADFPATVALSALLRAAIAIAAALVTTVLGLFAVADALRLNLVDASDLATAAVYLGIAPLCIGPLEAQRSALGRRTATQAQKAVLLHDPVHRTRNDLFRLEGPLRFQLRAAQDPAPRRALHEVEARVWALACVNARLYAVRTIGAGPRLGLVENELAANAPKCAVPAQHTFPVGRVRFPIGGS